MARLLSSLLLLVLTSCNPTDDPVAELVATEPSLATFLTTDGRATLFAEALVRTGLAKNASPFTRFAFVPTDAAFADSGVDPTTLSSEELTDLITYHLVDGASRVITSATEGYTQLYETYNTEGPEGTNLVLLTQIRGGTLSINGNRARGIGERLEQPDGELLYIDRVLLPPTLSTLLHDLPELSAFSTLIDGLPAISSRLAGEAPMTLFAPFDTAVVAASERIDNLGLQQLDALVRTHLFGKDVTHRDLFACDGQTLNEGQRLDLRPEDYSLMISYFQDPTNHRIYIPHVGMQTKNGTLYLVDRVLQPTSL